MVNTKKINELIEWYESNTAKEPNFSNWPWLRRDLWGPFMEALGDDEDKIIDFIGNADENTQGHMCSILENLYEKFPTEKMGAFLDDLWETQKKRNELITAQVRAQMALGN